MAHYPALDVRAVDPDLVLAAVDDHSPAAVQEHEDGLRVFFARTEDRDQAATAVRGAYPAAQVAALEVDDEDWARRSQENLQPVTVGRITILPAPRPVAHEAPGTGGTSHPAARTGGTSHPAPGTSGTSHLAPGTSGTSHPAPGTGGTSHPAPGTSGTSHPAPSTGGTSHPAPSTGTQHAPPRTQHPIEIIIAPSMGFGTGHHATTRLCLEALQVLDLTAATVLDLGTGSGILAIAADRLGARSAVGLDGDPDAIQAARENLAFNADVHRVTFDRGDIRQLAFEPADVVVANLTGALLVSAAAQLKSAVRDGGTLIVSGVLEHEEAMVRASIEPAAFVWRGAEDGWVALAANLRRTTSV